MMARLGDYLGFRKAQIQKAQEAIEEKKKCEEDYSMEKCIDIVDAMEGLSYEQKS
jgi:flagellin-specific chaperone FliS